MPKERLPFERVVLNYVVVTRGCKIQVLMRREIIAVVEDGLVIFCLKVAVLYYWGCHVCCLLLLHLNVYNLCFSYC